MLLARGGDESGPGTTQTQQNLSLLQNKWASLNAKMDDRRVKKNVTHVFFFSLYIILGLQQPLPLGGFFASHQYHIYFTGKVG